jgi:hypothetical protein
MAKRIGTIPKSVAPLERITQSILFVRGQKVMLVRIWPRCMG